MERKHQKIELVVRPVALVLLTADDIRGLLEFDRSFSCWSLAACCCLLVSALILLSLSRLLEQLSRRCSVIWLAAASLLGGGGGVRQADTLTVGFCQSICSASSTTFLEGFSSRGCCNN